MGTFIHQFKKVSTFFATLGILIAFGLIFTAAQPKAHAWDWDDNDGNNTLCRDNASRNVSIGSNDQISIWEKVKSGPLHPLMLVFSSNVNNSTGFDGGKAKVDLLLSPRPGCVLKKIIVNTTADCRLADTNPVQVKFTCSDAGQTLYNLDDPAIANPNLTKDFFNAANAVLGMGIPFPAACDNDLDTTEEQKACGKAVCQDILDQLSNGNTKQISTAGDLGALVGSMQTTLDRCTTKSDIFSFQGPTMCKPDKVAANIAYDLLTAAPEEHVQADSDGAGNYNLSILAGSTLFTPGDFFSINMNTCDPDFLVQ